MVKNIIVIISLLLSSVAFGQTELSMFQLIKKPLEPYVLNTTVSSSIDTIASIGDVFGDSVRVSGYCVLTDTTDVYSIHINVGNNINGDFNIYSDSLDYSLLQISDSLDVYRQGSVIFLDFGTFSLTDTLYGEAWLYRLNGEASDIIYYPLFD